MNWDAFATNRSCSCGFTASQMTDTVYIKYGHQALHVLALTRKAAGKLQRHSDPGTVNGLQQLCCPWGTLLLLLLFLLFIIIVWIIVVLWNHF